MKLKIREYRRKQDLTQQELADKVGCSRQYINMLENDESIDVGTKLLLGIATALGVTVDDLIFFEQ